MPNGNKTDNGVHEVGTDETRLAYQNDTPGQQVEKYLSQIALQNEEKQESVRKHFSQVFDNPLKGFPHNEEFEVTEIKEKVEYAEYKFKNKNDAQKALDYFKSQQQIDLDINDDGLSQGELAIDAGKNDMTKQHKEVLKKFRPKVLTTEIKEENLEEDYKKVIKMYPRDNDWKKLITKHKKAIDDFRKNNKDLPSKVEDELITWASQTGEVSHKDDVEDFIMSILDESIISENYRELAKHGMGAETKNSIKVGTEVDYYQKDGAKYMGKITKITPKGYIVRDDKTKKEHEFTYHDRNAANKLLKQGDNLGEGSMDGQKMTGQEISTYFRKNPIRDKDLKKAIEIALDHSGAMNYAIAQIEKLKKGLSKKTEVKKALQFANEEVKYKLNAGVVFKESKKLEAEIEESIKTSEGVMDAEPLKGKYPFQKKFSVESTFREMFETELQEAMLTYRVKKMQKPEIDKFESSARLMKLKVTFNHGKDDSLIVMTGNKKQLRDFDAVARGKSSYGDPSLAIKHFDEGLEEAISRDKNLSKNDISGVENYLSKSYINKKTLSQLSFDDDAIFHAKTGKTIFTSKDYIGKMTIDDLIKALEKKVK